MKLIIMRHGQASWSASNDELRPLTDFGRQEVQKTVNQLLNLGVDRIIASPYLRAQQTAQIAAQCLELKGFELKGLKLKVETLDVITPEDSPKQAIRQLPDSGCVLLVSHMPLVSGLTGLLCDGSPYGGPGFGTAHAAVLDLELPGAGLATLQKMITV